MLIQGYDFLYMFEKMNCIMQVEGSDQWGNITTGLDLIKKKTGKEAYGFTMPLILDSTGKKFGKSEGNALWLDKNKTSSYQLYQYLINTEDAKVEEYLKIFTFLHLDEIENIITKHKEEPHLRLAQKALAEQIITDLHGKEEFEHAKKISESLFSDKIWELKSEEIIESLKDLPTFEINDETNLVDLLVNHNICSSKREAREMITGKAINVNNTKITDIDKKITKKEAIEGQVILIKKGKKTYYLGIYK